MTTDTITMGGKVFTIKDTTYDSFTREELVSEVIALKSKNDKRAKAATKKIRDACEVKVANARQDQINCEDRVKEINKERFDELKTCNPTLETIIAWNRPDYKWGMPHFKRNDGVVYSLALELKEALQRDWGNQNE